MIGSFWNLCRACPSMPVDKQLHSEYRSTYRWHEYTGSSRPEVVRRPPAPNHFVSINEPPLPRRKKCPELAYKSHEFIIGSQEPVHEGRADITVTRARSEERGTPSRRSKSEGPPVVPNGRAYPVGFGNEVDGKGRGNSSQAGESSGLFKKTISKLSTEYRLQFVWPHVRKAITGQTNDAVDFPRKSLSMGTIKSSQKKAMPTVHKKRTTIEKEATVYELEPLVNEEERIIEKHFIERKTNGLVDEHDHHKQPLQNGQVIEAIADNKAAVNGWSPYGEQWYKEVIELRKKADEYKCRGWGIEIDPPLYKKQKELWDQVSKRSSLSALSLASSIHRPITKEEKDQENNKKTIPNKVAYKRVPGQAHLVDNKVSDESLLPARVQIIRHHLERTTGPDVEEGALLPSPTREKLMPAIPKSKDTDSHNSQKGSPKKSTSSKHGSPQKGSPQKGSPKKMIKGRSQSVGPGVIDTNESPKRQLRSVSTAPNASLASKPSKKTSTASPAAPERKPRPSTLSTSFHSRSKSSSLPPIGRTHSAPGNHHIQISQNDTNKTSTASNISQPYLRKTNKASKQPRPKSTITGDLTDTTKVSDDQSLTKNRDNKLAENNNEGQDTDGAISTGESPQLAQDVPEHIVKSPPEPTRVKSPEQIIMRSPDPVNWTVPLDTGKTFTVTQNVKDGESFTRPQSEVKASTPIEKPPPAPQSAPPELAEQEKMKAWKKEDLSEPDNSVPHSPSSSKSLISLGAQLDKPIPGSSQRCLDDPIFDSEPRSTASEVLEKARDRFDRFWGGIKEENA